jgi:uncharacterized protein (TIGR02246 family)
VGKSEVSEVRRVVERMMAATNARDIAAYVAMLHPEIELVLPGGITVRGREQVKKHVEGQWAAFPDGHLTCVSQLASGNRAATEIVLSATHFGALETPDGAVAPTGKRINVRFVALHEIRDGMASRERVYFDQLELLMQLGLTPAVREARTA